jgi:hypothetical protein
MVEDKGGPEIVKRIVLISERLRSLDRLFFGFRQPKRWPGCGNGLSKGSECCTDLGREQLGFFPSGEMAALVDLVEVDDIGIRLLDPAARGTPDLAGERGEANWNRDGR